MKNKKLIMAVVALTMCASTTLAFTGCNNEPEHTHSYKWTQTKAPTCSAAGEEDGVCLECEDAKTRPIAIDPDAHKFAEEWEVTAPTAEAPGKAIKKCIHNAEHAPIEATLPALSEESAYKSVTPVEGQEPTHTSAGKMKYVFAHESGDVSFIVDVPAGQHDYKWETVKEATCDEPGLEKGTCSCGDTQEREIPAGNHKYEWTVVKEATCDEPGSEKGVCSNCKDEQTKEIPKTPHAYEADAQTLVKPSLYLAGGVTIKCKNFDDHSFDLTLPTLDSEEYEVTPLAGKNTANYKYTDETTGAEVTFEATLYNAVNMDEIIETAMDSAELVGKAEGINGSTKWSYEYNADRSYAHVYDQSNNRNYYIDNNDGEISGLCQEGELRWIYESEQAFYNGYSFFLPYLPLISDAEYIGVENLLYRLNYYASTHVGELENYKATSYKNDAGKTVNMFTFNRLVKSTPTLLHSVGVDGTNLRKSFYSYSDKLYTYTVSFTTDDNGMVTWLEVNTSVYGYDYEALDYQLFKQQHAGERELPDKVTQAEFDLLKDSMTKYGVDRNAFKTDNPIKGYDTGVYYGVTGKESNTHIVNGTQTALADIEEFPENPHDLADANVKSFVMKDKEGKVIESGTSLDIDNSSIKNINIDVGDSREYINLNEIKVRVFTKDAAGNDQEWTEGDNWGNILVNGQNVYAKAYVNSDGTINFGFRSQRLEGEFKVIIRIGEATAELVFRNEFGAASVIEPETYVYSYASDDFSLVTEKEIEVYAGQAVHFNAITKPSSGNSYFTDNEFRIEATGATLTDADPEKYGEGAKTFTAATPGNYTVELTAVKGDSFGTHAKATVSIIVKAVPTEEELFSGEHASGAYKVAFGDNKSVKITDASGVTEYTYAFNAETLAVTLTKVSGEGNYGLEVTPAYTFRLTYENSVSHEKEKVMLVKVPDYLTAEAAVSGSVWEYTDPNQGQAYIVFDGDGLTAYATKDPANTTPDGSTVYKFTYALKAGANNIYEMEITPSGPNPMMVGWFAPGFTWDQTARLVFDGQSVTSLTVYGNKLNREFTAAEVGKLLNGKTFTTEDGKTLEVNDKGVMTFNYSAMWRVSFTFALTADAEDKSKFNFTFTEVEGSKPNNMIDYAFLVSVASGNSYVKLNGSEMEIYLNIGTSASSAKLTKMTVYVDPVLAILDDLTGKTMEADVKSAKVVLTFGENGAMHLDYNNGVATDDFLLTLTAAAEEGKYNITLEQKAASPMLSMVFDYNTANSGSYLTLADNVYNVYLNWSDGYANPESVKFAEVQEFDPSSLLEGTTWNYRYDRGDAFALVFGENNTVTAKWFAEDGVNTEEYAYTLTAGDNGKYFFAFSVVDTSWGDCGIDTGVSNGNESYLIIENGEIIELTVTGTLNGDTVAATYEKDTGEEPVEPGDKFEQYYAQLAGKTWEGTFTENEVEYKLTIVFGNDKTLTATRTGGDTEVTDEKFSFELADGSWGQLAVTFTALDGAAGNCGIDPENANANSVFLYDMDNNLQTLYIATASGDIELFAALDIAENEEQLKGTLAGTSWTYSDGSTEFKMTFNADGTMSAIGGDTDLYNYNLVNSGESGKYLIVFKFAGEGYSNGYACGIDEVDANKGSYITVESDAVTGFSLWVCDANWQYDFVNLTKVNA